MYGLKFYFFYLVYVKDVIFSRFNFIINYMNLSVKMKKYVFNFW